MSFEEFNHSIKAAEPPRGLSASLLALWFAAKGDWDAAHEKAQNESTKAGAWVHAYLHRKEGDLGNARYWYSMAGQRVSTKPIDTEWAEIASALLEERSS